MSDQKKLLQEGMDKFSDLVSWITPEQLKMQIQETGGKWTAIEILRHGVVANSIHIHI